jgi:hypothetical protein
MAADKHGKTTRFTLLNGQYIFSVCEKTNRSHFIASEREIVRFDSVVAVLHCVRARARIVARQQNIKKKKKKKKKVVFVANHQCANDKRVVIAGDLCKAKRIIHVR